MNSKENKKQVKAAILNLISEFEDQGELATLSQLQRGMFLIQTILDKKMLEFSIFNYGPNSLEMESILDELLVEGEIDRLGSYFRVSSNVTYQVEEETVKGIVYLLNNTRPSDIQKVCTVYYYKNRSDSELCAFESATRVSPRGSIDDFRNVFQALSGQISSLASA